MEQYHTEDVERLFCVPSEPMVCSEHQPIRRAGPWLTHFFDEQADEQIDALIDQYSGT
jgi:hypothetical protein